jgi:hypothetical protein
VRAGVALNVLIALGGCVVVPASKVNTSRDVSAPVILGEGRRIAVMYSADFAPLIQRSLGLDMVDCIRDAVRAGVPHVAVLTQDQFFPLIFPGLSARQVLIRADTIPALLAREEIRRRLDEAEIDHLILVDAQPVDTSYLGGLHPAFLVGGWDRKANMQASIFDLQHGAQVGTGHAHAGGVGFYLVVMGVPLGGGVAPEAPTCKALGSEVVRVLLGSSEPEKK